MAIDTSNTYKPAGTATNRAGSGNATPSAKSKTEDGVRQAAAQPNDTVALSPEAQNLSRLQEKMETAPDIDSERVAQIRQAISEGRFEINAERLAEAMLNQDELLG